MRKMLALFAVLLLAATVTLAHGDEHHLMGTVTKITDKSITIEDKNKKTTEVGIAPDTKCMKADAAAALKDIKVGDRVVIHARKSGDKLVATLVKIGAASQPAHKH